MKRLVLDTSYLVGHFHSGDAHHEGAIEIQDDFMSGRWEGLVLLDSVFAETLTVLERRTDYGRAKQVGDALRNADEITWLHLGDRMDAAWNTYLTQPRGRLSLVDCALVTVCQESGITDIATFDRAFDDVPGIRRVPEDRGLNASSGSPASPRAAPGSPRSTRAPAKAPRRAPPRRRS